MMADDDDVTSPLIKPSEAEASVWIVKPRRKWVVEPLLFFYSLFTIPSLMCRSQFIYMKFAQSLNASAAIAFNTNSSSTCDVNKSSPEFLLRQEIQSASSYFMMELTLVYSASAIVSAVYLCSLSDTRGRRYALIPSTSGDVLGSAVLIVVSFCDLDVRYLFIGECISGIGGGWETILVASFAYIADITTPKERGFRIVILELSFYLSAGCVSILTGYMIRYIGFHWIFVIVSGGKFVGLMYVIFFIPETVKPLQIVRIWSLGHFKHSFRIFKNNGADPSKNRRFACLFVAFFFSSLVSLTMGIDTLFEMNTPLCWNSVRIGYYQTVYIVVAAVGGGILAKIMNRFFSDTVTAILSAAAEMVKNLYKAFCVTSFMMYFVPVFAIFSTLLTPMIRTLVSKEVGPTNQGAAFSFLAVIQIVCSCFGNLLFNTIYSNTLYIMAGFVFITSGLTEIFVICVLSFYFCKYKRWEESTEHREANKPIN